SNQWNACAATTRSTLPAGSPVRSALPSTLWKPSFPPCSASAAWRIARFGSTAKTRLPCARKSSEERSEERRVGKECRAGWSARLVSGGGSAVCSPDLVEPGDRLRRAHEIDAARRQPGALRAAVDAVEAELPAVQRLGRLAHRSVRLDREDPIAVREKELRGEIGRASCRERV